MSDKNVDITEIATLADVTIKTDEELLTCIGELGLSMSPLFLREVYRYLAIESIAPSYELLCFFDAIYCASLQEPKNITLGEISTEDTEVMRTLVDLRQKAAYLKKAPAFPITDILEISSEYLSTLDIKAPSSVTFGEGFSISDSNGNVLVNLGIDGQKPLRYGYVKESKNETSSPERRNIPLNIPTNKVIVPDGEINIKPGFINRLLSFGEKLDAQIKSEPINPTKYEKLFYTAPESEKKRELCEVAELKNHLVAARYTKDLSFGDGMNTVLDSLFALLAKGADRRNVGITIKLGVRRENISFGIAALLGAYRVIMELCLPEINSELVFSDEEYIICTAFAQKEQTSRNTDFFIEIRKLYLLSPKRYNSSLPPRMPDFDDIRNMCDRLYDGIKDGTVLLAHPIDGTLSSVTDGLQITKEAGSMSDDTIAQGFVIEAKSFVKIDAPSIGILHRTDDIQK